MDTTVEMLLIKEMSVYMIVLIYDKFVNIFGHDYGCFSLLFFNSVHLMSLLLLFALSLVIAPFNKSVLRG